MAHSDNRPNAILFVCLGNICRSPLAEGAAHAFAHSSGWNGHIDSAGTGAWHIGNPPDPRSIAIAADNGVDIRQQKARQVKSDDLHNFDLICAMDNANLRDLQQLNQRAGQTESRARLALLMDFAPGHEGSDIPDPYYGGDDGFAHVWRLISLAMPHIFGAAQR